MRPGRLPAGAAGRGRQAGPRALRSAALPWGLHDLTRREGEQVDLGSALLRATVLLLFMAWARRFAAVMEHPWLPWEGGAPSSWRLPEMVALQQLEGVVLVRLDQCCAGAPSMKPTGLLAVRLPELGAALGALPGGGRCGAHLGHAHVELRGRDDSGGWRTAPAKTYPPAMCRALAGAFVRRCRAALGNARGAPRLPVAEELARLCVPIDWYDPDAWEAFAPDFAGGRPAP